MLQRITCTCMYQDYVLKFLFTLMNKIRCRRTLLCIYLVYHISPGAMQNIFIDLIIIIGWSFYASLVCLKAQENIFCLLYFLHSFHVLELWLPGLAVFEQCQSVYFYHLTEPIHVQVLHAELWGSPREKTTS